jgi:hypothetical protein
MFRVKAALEVFGARELADRVDAHTWARTGATLRLGEPPMQIDVLLQSRGVEYHEVSPKRRDRRRDLAHTAIRQRLIER